MTKNTKTTENKTVKILSTQGSELGQMNLEGSVFGVEPNTHVMYLALKRQLNNARAGLACTKTRADFRLLFLYFFLAIPCRYRIIEVKAETFPQRPARCYSCRKTGG